MIGGDLAPRHNQSLLNGATTRILNPALLRTRMGLGDMATQSSSSVSISGGSANFSSMTAFYNYGYYNYVYQHLQLLNASPFYESNQYYNSSGSLGLEVNSFVDGESYQSCQGTAPACSSYDYGSCPTEIGCTPTVPYCPNYNGDETACSNAGCTNDQTTYYCSSYTDSSSCTNANPACSWDFSDTCSSYTNSMDCTSGHPECTWTPPSYCSDFTDETSCNNHGSPCGWVPDQYESCAGYDEATCNSYSGSGCTPNYIDDGMGGTVYDSCSGSRLIASAYCGGGTISSGGCSGGVYNCNGSWSEYAGTCSGSPSGFCDGTSTCATASSGNCASYSGCSLISQMPITLPSIGSGLRKNVHNVSLNNADILLRCVSGQRFWDGTTEKNLSSYGSSLHLVGYGISRNCSILDGDATTCNNTGSCYHDGSNCVGSTFTDNRWYNSPQT